MTPEELRKQGWELDNGKVLDNNKKDKLSILLASFNLLLIEGYHDFLARVLFARSDN